MHQYTYLILISVFYCIHQPTNKIQEIICCQVIINSKNGCLIDLESALVELLIPLALAKSFKIIKSH